MRTASASATSPRNSSVEDSWMGHRRTCPAESSSLPLHKKQKLDHTPDRVDDDLAGAKVSSLPRRESTGPGSTASGSKWFDSANQHVKSGKRTSPQTSDEPPFFLNSQHAFNPNNFVSSGSEEAYGQEHRDRTASENEDLRGVIDDLTIENKQLKRLLKTCLPRSAPTIDAQDKLFELRVHGLPAEKKRELERLLRSFASSATLPSKSIPSSSATYGSGQVQSSEWSSGSNQPQVLTARTQTDSGYASNSNSNLNSVTVSNTLKSQIYVSQRSRNKTIKSYLHDIPDSLLPRQPPFMTDSAKMTLVVRRLEQLFTGNKAAPGDHMQPTQQQEVSNSAARADASGSNQPRRLEGSREAHILPHDSKLNLDALNQEPSTHDRVAKLKRGIHSAGNSDAAGDPYSRPDSPEQRPTRPLDLDIHRAQVAADNMEYLRHLGLTTPQITTSGDHKESSWIYLNLLISMAQLHTINVTPTFIRRAIRKISTKLELSPDGHKVRWKGGAAGTPLVPQDEERGMDPTTDSMPDNGGDNVRHRRSKRSKTTSSSNNVSEERSSEAQTSGNHSSSGPMQHISTAETSTIPTSQTQNKRSSAFDYQPLFYKGNKYPTHASYLDSTSPSGSGGSRSAANTLSRWSLDQPRNDEGTIIFFNTPHFCSDASADRALVDERSTIYVLPEHTIGIKNSTVEDSPFRHHDACYFAPHLAGRPYVSRPDEPLISFEPTPFTSAGDDEKQPMDLPVSGIGGVSPEDNFALDVKIGRLRQPECPSTEKIPFTGNYKLKRYSYRVLRCETIRLQASKLPPPSYLFFTHSSSSDSRQSFLASGSDTSSSLEDETFPPPAAFLNSWDSGGTSDDEMERDTSSGFDMLAIARGADAKGLTRQDPVFGMSNLDNNIKVGASVAATVGASRSSGSSNAGEGRKYDSDDNDNGDVDSDDDEEEEEEEDDHDDIEEEYDEQEEEEEEEEDDNEDSSS